MDGTIKPQNMRIINTSDGYSLVEVLFALIIFTIGILAV